MKSRVEELFLNRKKDWGQNRRRWSLNYLQSYSLYSDKFIFSCVILTTNIWNLEHFYGLAIENSIIKIIDLDSSIIHKQIHIHDIEWVSLGTDVDQFVCLHFDPIKFQNDFIFGLYSKPPENFPIGLVGHLFHQSPNVHSKIGEFVIVLGEQFNRITGQRLKINFSDNIHFRFHNMTMNIHLISLRELNVYKYHHRVQGLISIKTLRNTLYRITGRKVHSKEFRNVPRCKFEKISSNTFLFGYPTDEIFNPIFNSWTGFFF